ncbi:hypothetical protein PsAD2_04641 [Pseudovibrio axinellae]|uniref:Uncharacterized protein n=1 Tax=Pseudovibrio axinellae TaxID=989403 RepID=A0A165SW72_9HYPH|nr:hypothetical protein [Pseudovibrio axinellae]KZL04558.1 hypothetical protein PsAD2_04641 [Pseudovibrio axinellae]SEQ73129.1 hypothetical protein SAMN05421798_10467 [Pseudovibrio axinellae]
MSKKNEFDEMQLLELTLEDSTNAEITSAIFAMLSKQQQNLIVEGLEQNRDIAATTEIQPVREIRMKIYEKRLQRLKMMQEHEDELA